MAFEKTPAMPTTVVEDMPVDSEQLAKPSQVIVDDHDWEESRRKIVRKIDLHLMPLVSYLSMTSYIYLTQLHHANCRFRTLDDLYLWTTVP